jgi:LmbE family N-acetylglucosaminyl deacetylase
MGSHDTAHPNADLIYRLRSLPMAAAVLQLGVHPDDEDSGTIAYLSRGLGVRTVYWSATRGEGGQNRLGSEKGEALGIVRTWESLEARQIDGGEVLYGPFYDFGFSKSAEAAFSKWDREDLVREVARAIRMVQPLVVISRWSGGPSDGHGQHQAVGHVAAEAFEAAASADRFPELDRLGLAPWRARKLYRSMQGDWQPGEDVTLGRRVPEFERDGVVRINAGEFDPVSGRTYQELAALGRNRHRSQAMAELPERGDHFSYYRLERSLVEAPRGERGFFDGLDPTLTGMVVYAGGGPEGLDQAMADARSHAEAAVRAFHPGEPVVAGEAVLRGLGSLRAAARLVETDRGADTRALRAALERRIRQFEDAAVGCFGIRLDAAVDPRRVVPGDPVRVSTRVWCQAPDLVEDVELALRVPDGWTAEADAGTLVGGSEGEPIRQAAFEVGVPESAEVSCPYWLREPRDRYRYRWPESGPCGQPFDPPLVVATANLTLAQHRLALEAPGVSRETFVGGFRELPLAVLPPMALQPREDRVMLPIEEDDQEVELQVSARATREQGAKGDLVPRAPEGWTIRPQEAALLLPRGGESRAVAFQLRIPGGSAPGVYRVAYDFASDTQRHGLVVQPVWQAAPGVRKPPDETTCVAEAFVTSPAAVTVDLVEAAFVRTLSYGYVHGVEEQILPSLSRSGLDVSVLSDEDLSFGDLGSFDAIVVGPNAYLVRDAVRRSSARLLEYVELGGTLIVQYQAYGYQAEGFTPYPFRYHQPHGRVTFPNAPVTVLDPAHPVLHLPNRISERDFEGWVHDRGLYFWGEWDRRYAPVLECHDPGEEPQRGGLLVAGYGQGTFAYTGYSLFRQIPFGVPGAIRLFANLLGLAEARILERMERARRVQLFSFMSDDQLHDVVRLMSERWFDDGAFLARQGAAGNELFLIVEGEVEILKERGDRKVHVAREGEAVGELAVLADTPRSASLRSRGGTKVLSMRGDHFRRLLREHRDLADGLIRMLATRLAESGE